MYKAELELEKRLNDIASASVPATSYENIVVVPKRKQEVPLKMSPDEFDLRDLAYDQKMAVISSNAIVNKLGWKPSKIKSDVTKLMIQEFQYEQMKNIKNGVYIPSSLDLDLLELPEKPETLEGRPLTTATRTLKRLVGEMNAIQARLAEVNGLFEDQKTAWASKQSRLLLNADRMFPDNAIRRNLTKARIRKDAEEELQAIIGSKEEYVTRLQEDYIDREARAADLNQTIQDSTQAVRDYQKELTEVTAENDRRRKMYQDQIRQMNTGINIVEMLPSETVDEYKQRLKDIGDSTGNEDSIQAAASLLYSDQLRENMKEITRDDELIGTFIRGLTTDERFSLVREFPLFKKAVIDIFGKNNSFMSVEDLRNVGDTFANRVAIEAASTPELFKRAEASTIETAEAVVVEEGTTPLRSSRGQYTLSKGIIKSGISKDKLLALQAYAAGGDVPTPGRLQAYNLGLFNTEIARIDAWKAGEGESRSVPTLERAGSSDIRPFLRPEPPAEEPPSLADLQLGIQEIAAELAEEDEKDRLLALLGVPTRELLVKRLTTAGLLDAVIAKRGTTGRGLHPKYPKFYPFGVIEISPHKLFYENILKVTRKGKHLTGFPNVKVSDAFVKFMFKIIEGGQPSLKEVNKLSAGEKQLFDSVVFTAGLSREVETTGSGVKQDLKNRLALIEGEVEAGNTNPELVKEARKILQHLARMKIIGHRAAATHLKQLINAQRE
jgi:hypothetical protein